MGSGTPLFQAYTTPHQISTTTGWSKIATGYRHVLALKTNGTLWYWGNNSNGQLGNNSTVQTPYITQLGTLTTWTDIAAGNDFSAALKSDGSMWTWGYNLYGQLGNGNNNASLVPIQVGVGSTWSNVEAGYSYVIAKKSNNTLWSFGQNALGYLGLGNTTNYSVPNQIGTSATWQNLYVGYYSAIATQSNLNFYGWGRNSGQLGDGTTAAKSSPTLMPYTCVISDVDQDGYTVAQGDCNDNNANINPGAIEICGNAFDDNCDGEIYYGELYFTDFDLDTWVADSVVSSCFSASYLFPFSSIFYEEPGIFDCNDLNPLIHPTAVEIFSNSIDENCDGIIACEVAISSQPTDVFAPIGGIANFTLNISSANSGVSYQWQTLFNGQWINLFNAGQYAGVNTASLAVNNLNQNNYGKWFRCYLTSVQNAFCPTYSDSVTIYGCDSFQQTFEITASQDTVCFGNEVHLEVPALTTCSSGLHGIVLNEVMINAAGACDGSCTPSSGEWVELYNNDIFPVDLECYIITDGDFSVTLPAGSIIPGNGFLVVGSSNSGVPINIDIATCGCTTGPNAQVGIFTNSAEQVLLFDDLGTITDGIVWGGGQWSQQTFFTTNTIGNCSSTTVPINPNFPQIQTVPAQSLYDGQSVFRSCDGAGSWAVGAYPPTAGQSNNSMNGSLNVISSFVDDTLHYLSDLNSCQYFNIQVSDMSNGGLTNINEIVSVNVNMEHSFLGDLDITLYCPSGQSIILHQNGNIEFSASYPGVGTFLGVPVDVIGPTDPPGIGWDYSWAPSSTLGTWISNVSSGTAGTLPSGNYSSIEPFSDLLGCPINGIWTIEFCDMWGADDGWLFNWGLEFNNSISTSVQSFYDTITWQGNTLNWDDGNGNAYFSPNQYGPNEYSVLATLSNGCVLSDTISIESVGPIISLVPEVNTCSLPVVLNPSVQGISDSEPTCSQAAGVFNYCYSNNDSWSWTFCPDVPYDGVSLMTFSFISGQMEGFFETINVYDGPDETYPQIGNWTSGDASGYAWTASNSSGCITITFTADGSVSCASGSYEPWTYDVSCTHIAPQYSWTYFYNPTVLSEYNTLNTSILQQPSSNTYVLSVASYANGLYCTDSAYVVVNFVDASILLQPVSVEANLGDIVYFSCIASPGVTYQWQILMNGVWTNLFNAGQFSGVNTSQLSVSNVNLNNVNQQFQCVISSADGGCTDTSNIVSINFCDIASSSIPSVLNISLNSSPNIGITPVTNGATYQWQSNVGFGWMNISDGSNYSGTSTPNLQILTADWQNENEWLQCVVTTNLCSDTTNICVVHITPMGIDETEAGSIYYYENAIHFSKISAALGQPYYVFDGSGKLISEGIYFGNNSIELDLQAAGVYCFKLGDEILKFIKIN